MQIAQKNQIKYAVHFHELQSQYNFIAENEMQELLSGASFTVGCCECVCNNLQVLNALKIRRQYECFESLIVKVDIEKKQTLRKELQIPDEYTVITMSGQRTERKGLDLFIQVARELRDKPYFFLWLGASQNKGYDLFYQKLITHHGLKNIQFIHPGGKIIIIILILPIFSF